MKIKIFNIALLLSICTVANTHTSDRNAQQYPFSDYDKNVFTNYVTNKVTLIYSTPFIESMSHKPITMTSGELKALLYPALTQITYKRDELLLRVINSNFSSAQTPEQKKWCKTLL